MENLPKHFEAAINAYKPQYWDLKFNTQLEFNQWLKANCKTEIHFKDEMQDLTTLYIAETGEVLHVDFSSLGNIYNGALLLNSVGLINEGVHISLYVPSVGDVCTIKYPVERIIKY